MALNIEVFDGNFKITSDADNVIVYRKINVDPTKAPNWEKRKKEGASPDKYEKWVNPTYHGTIEKALMRIAEQRIRDSDATTLAELLHEIKGIRREISDVLSVRV